MRIYIYIFTSCLNSQDKLKVTQCSESAREVFPEISVLLLFGWTPKRSRKHSKLQTFIQSRRIITLKSVKRFQTVGCHVTWLRYALSIFDNVMLSYKIALDYRLGDYHASATKHGLICGHLQNGKFSQCCLINDFGLSW